MFVEIIGVLHLQENLYRNAIKNTKCRIILCVCVFVCLDCQMIIDYYAKASSNIQMLHNGCINVNTK